MVSRSDTDATNAISGALEPRKNLFVPVSEMSARRGEVPSLDGLRAGSILLVMCSHFISGKIFPGGLGVLVFFVISGFLITRLLLAEKKQTGAISLVRFYARRMLRLYPLIVLYVACAVVVGLLVGIDIHPGEIMAALLYYANYYYDSIRMDVADMRLPLQILWSLSVEEHFYIVFPSLLILLSCDMRRLIPVVVAILVGALAWRLWMAHLHPDYLTTKFFYERSEMRMDALGSGVLLAACCETPRGRALLLRLTHPAFAVAAVMLVLACLVYRDLWFRETWRYTLLNTAVAILVAGVLFSDRYRLLSAVLNSPLVVTIGRLSYSLYIWHFGVYFILGLFDMAPLPNIVLAFTLSCIVAFLSYAFVEQPFVGLRHRFGSTRKEALPLTS